MMKPIITYNCELWTIISVTVRKLKNFVNRKQNTKIEDQLWMGGQTDDIKRSSKIY